MSKQNDIIEELKELGSPLADMSRKMPFAVPGGYFLGIAAETQYLIKALAVDEPVIKGLDKAIPYTTPHTYFETLPQKMLAAAKQANVTQKKTITPNWQYMLRWSAAAVVVIGIGIGSYLNFSPRKANPEKLLANMPKNVISDYVQQHIDQFDTEMILRNSGGHIAMQPATKQLDDKEIIQYLNEDKTEIN